MTGTDVPLADLPHPSAVVDSGGAIVGANEAARDRFGDVEGRALSSLFANEDPAPEDLLSVDSATYMVSENDDNRLASVRASPLEDGDTLVVFREPGQRPPIEDADGMLDALLTHIPVSVYFKDRESRHVRVSAYQADDLEPNPEGKAHHTPADVQGKTEFDLYPIEAAESSVADDAFVMRTGEPIESRDEQIERPDGETQYVTTAKAPWYENGEIQGIVGVTFDVTERMRHERELERQNERLEDFAGVVSHDLRNPLEVARGNLEMYRQTGDEEHLDTVARMHNRMEALIDDTLSLARVGERVTQPTTVYPASAVDAAWSAVQTGEATLECALEGTIMADETRLVQLFENLFANALEHGSTSPPSDAQEDAIEHGGPDIHVTVEPLADRPGFAVEDDGPGVPVADRETVFERGYSTGEGGTGFGLAIVEEIAEAHGWTVTVTEGAEGGARFEVAFDETAT